MIEQEVKAIWDAAAVLARPDVATLELTGPDRVRFLNGMVSNDVARLTPGKGLFALKTSSRGRVEGVLRVRALEDRFRVDLSAGVAERVRAILEQFIIMDDCAVRDVSSERDVVSIFGPRANDVIGAPDLEPHAFAVEPERVVIKDAMLGLLGYELHVPRGEGDAVARRLVDNGAVPMSFEALDVARIEAGTPLDGRDIDDDTIPMEARLERGLSFEKGCYVGQEVIARATNLGGVKHILVGLAIDGDALPAPGAAILLGESGTQIGELTSVARSVSLGRIIGLGYVRRAHETPGTRLRIDVAGAPVAASVAELPFVSR